MTKCPRVAVGMKFEFPSHPIPFPQDFPQDFPQEKYYSHSMGFPMGIPIPTATLSVTHSQEVWMLQCSERASAGFRVLWAKG